MSGKFEVFNKRDQVIGRGGSVKLKTGQTIADYEADAIFEEHKDIDQLCVLIEIHGLDIPVAFFNRKEGFVK